MRVESNLQRSELILDSDNRLFGKDLRIVAALDVEWVKNYHVKGGSRPFCYSICLLRILDAAQSAPSVLRSFGFKSVYVDNAKEEGALLRSLNDDLTGVTSSPRITIAGHQLCADLSVVLNATSDQLDNVEALYALWRERRKTRRGIDTRYDIDSLLLGTSRRLVDVATELRLDVSQPELGKNSMTALHKLFLSEGTELVREKLMVLNLRHSLSTAIIAAIKLGEVRQEELNVNRLIRETCWDRFSYVDSENFETLL